MTDFDRWIDLVVWGGTLMVTGYLMGTLYEHKNAQVFTHLTEQPKETLGQVDDDRGDIALAFLSSGQARFVEAPAVEDSSVETTATTVQSNGTGS